MHFSVCGRMQQSPRWRTETLLFLQNQKSLSLDSVSIYFRSTSFSSTIDFSEMILTFLAFLFSGSAFGSSIFNLQPHVFVLADDIVIRKQISINLHALNHATKPIQYRFNQSPLESSFAFIIQTFHMFDVKIPASTTAMRDSIA